MAIQKETDRQIRILASCNNMISSSNMTPIVKGHQLTGIILKCMLQICLHITFLFFSFMKIFSVHQVTKTLQVYNQFFQNLFIQSMNFIISHKLCRSISPSRINCVILCSICHQLNLIVLKQSMSQSSATKLTSFKLSCIWQSPQIILN